MSNMYEEEENVGNVSSFRAEPRSLGTGNTQASPGDHIHDGVMSRRLMTGVTITGSRGGNAALTNLITALADALGFEDATT